MNKMSLQTVLCLTYFRLALLLSPEAGGQRICPYHISACMHVGLMKLGVLTYPDIP